MGSFAMPGTESANKSGRTGELDGKVVEVTGRVVAGEINGGGVDKMGRLSRSGDLALPVFRVEVTRPTSSAISRIPLTRPDSRSSSEGLWESGRDGEDAMSRAVGSITGRGAGALVTETVGKLESDFGNSGFDVLGFG